MQYLKQNGCCQSERDAVEDDRRKGFLEDLAFDIHKRENRADGNNVVNCYHIAHRGARALQGEQRAHIQAGILGDGRLNSSKSEIRDRGGPGKETAECAQERGKILPCPAGDARERITEYYR